MEKLNNVTRFLLPAFKLKSNDVLTLDYLKKYGFENAFLCSQYKTKYEIYLKFHIDKVNLEVINFLYKIKKLKFYKGTLIYDRKVVIILEFPLNMVDKIYLPFINGKFNAIRSSSNYKFSYFAKNDIKGNINKSWALLNNPIPKDFNFSLEGQIFKQE